jgi:hypothetical protein
MPVTTPVTGSISAIPVAILLHVPPVDASDKVIVDPAHTSSKPVTAGGGAFTAITTLTAQPLLIVYTAVAVPPVVPMPVSTPVTGSIVAIAAGVTLHVPPLTASVSVIVLPERRHTDDGPPIAGGTGFTVTTATAGQPVPGLVVVIVAVP